MARLWILIVLALAAFLFASACGAGDGDGEPAAPVSPAALKIAFDAERDGDRDIYVINADGSAETRLTDDLPDPSFAAWSPDGSHILFVTLHGGGEFDIYVMNADGTGQTLLTRARGEIFPSWSPDGERIAFGNLYVMNANGSDIIQITEGMASGAQTGWSPDGSRIAFSADYGGERDEIFVVDADGTDLTNLTNDPSTCGYYGFGCFDWSPDGKRIVVEASSDLYVMNADGSGKTLLTSGRSPAWSPDGTRIAFVSVREGNAEVFVMNADGSEKTFVTNGGAPAWSPDGSQIAFISNVHSDPHDESGDIYVMNADGSGKTLLTNGPGDHGGFIIAWQPVP